MEKKEDIDNHCCKVYYGKIRDIHTTILGRAYCAKCQKRLLPTQIHPKWTNLINKLMENQRDYS